MNHCLIVHVDVLEEAKKGTLWVFESSSYLDYLDLAEAKQGRLETSIQGCRGVSEVGNISIDWLRSEESIDKKITHKILTTTPFTSPPLTT